MKKIFAFLFLTAGISLHISAQNTWTGTTTPTTTTGNVGINNSNPTAKLEIDYTFPPLFPSGGIPIPSLRINNKGGNANGYIIEIKNKETLSMGSPTYTYFGVRGDGLVNIYKRLQIGKTASNGSYANYALSVDGDMIAKRCVIQVSDWADYVFNDNYEMPTLSELETFINNNNHLPGIPTTEEVKEKGVEVGDMNRILLQKVEELTLYMIDLQKQNETLKSRIENLECAN